MTGYLISTAILAIFSFVLYGLTNNPLFAWISGIFTGWFILLVHALVKEV